MSKPALEVLRLDDIPLLYARIEQLGVQEIVDEVIHPHGNWKGLSMGHTLSIWLCYMLSEADHRLSTVEAWAAVNVSILSVLSGESVCAKHFTDDRLEELLDYLSDPGSWRRINNKLTHNSLEVYDLETQTTIRLDAAPFQGHHNLTSSALFKHGHHKHHNPNLGMLKVMLASVDNSINGFGYPLVHMTVSGNQADDVLYISMVKQCEETLAACAIVSRKLYVGDSKMGSQANRYYIFSTKNDYLMPLSRVQLSDNERIKAIDASDSKAYKKAYKTDEKGKKHLIAQGFEQTVEVSYTDEQGEVHTWEERRIFVRSKAYAKSQQAALDNRIQQATDMLNTLLVRKKGKRVPKTKAELEQCVDDIIKDKKVSGLLNISITEHKHSKPVRGYGDKPDRVETWSTFELSVQPDQEAINERKKLLGWQVYATTVDEQKLDFENIVWKYRHQNRIETRFNDLRNKVIPLIPIFLQKDNRVEALINVLMIGLKVCALMEFTVAKNLKKNGEVLDKVYEGNPKRSTTTPTAKRLLRQFKGISMVILKYPEQPPQVYLTDLKEKQLKIIQLMGHKPSIYKDLPQKIKLFFSSTKIPEM